MYLCVLDFPKSTLEIHTNIIDLFVRKIECSNRLSLGSKRFTNNGNDSKVKKFIRNIDTEFRLYAFQTIKQIVRF